MRRLRALRGRKVAAVLVAVGLAVSACNEAEDPVRFTPDTGSDSGAAVNAQGAQLIFEQDGVAPQQPRPDATPSTPPPSSPEGVVAAASDVLEAFVDALGTGQFGEAVRFTSGPAAEFTRFLEGQTACGFDVIGYQYQPPTSAELVAADTFRLDASAALVLPWNTVRTASPFEVQRLRDGSWRVNDFSVEGLTTGDLTIGPEDFEGNAVELTPISACVGPDKIEATFKVVNTDDELAFEPQEVSFRLHSGEQVPLSRGEASILALIPPGQQGPDWHILVRTPKAYQGGELVILARDPIESEQEGVDVINRRRFTIPTSKFFYDEYSDPS